MNPLSKLLDLICPLRVRYRKLQSDYGRMSTLFALANNALTPEQRTAVFGCEFEKVESIDVSGLPYVNHLDLRTVEPDLINNPKRNAGLYPYPESFGTIPGSP